MSTTLVAVTSDAQREEFVSQLAADDRPAVAAATYGEAVIAAQTEIIDSALIVDLALAANGALRLIRELRAGEHHDLRADLPIVALLPSEAGELELVRAFELGADDVARQPVGYLELRWRLKAVLGRSSAGGQRARRCRVGDLQVDLLSRTARVREQRVPLSRLEFDLLAVLSGDPERVFSRHELMREIWDAPGSTSSRTLDSHACRLRAKLAEAGGSYVANRHGIGYSLLRPS